MELPVSEDGTLAVRVTPRAARNRLLVEGGVVRAYVTSVPEDGKANAAVVKLLAKALGLPKSAVALVRGHTSRDKVFRISRRGPLPCAGDRSPRAG